MSTQDIENSRKRENEDFIVVNNELLEHVFIKWSYREIIIIRDKYLCIMQNVESISILTIKISFVIIFNWKFYVRLFFTFAKALSNTTFTKTRETSLFCTRFTCIWIKCVFVISTWKRWTSLRSFFTYIRRRIWWTRLNVILFIN